MKSINQNAPVLCRKNILIDATPERVWQVLTNINEWSAWQSDIRKPVLNGPVAPGTTFHWKTGGAKIYSTIHTAEPYTRFGWTGKTAGLFAIHNWILKEINGKTVVTVAESMEGFLASLLKKSFNKKLESGMIKWLQLLKRQSEL